MQTNTPWLTGTEAWRQFVYKHPELGYRPGKWGFHNFLRHFRGQLESAGAIRMAKRKFWIAKPDVFVQVAFDCATGAFRHGGQQ